MKETEVWKVCDPNRIAFMLDSSYKELMRKVCKDAMSTFSGIPVTWEDAYNQFLFSAIKIVQNYDPELGVPFKTFLGLKCKYFTKNLCRKYCTNKYKVLNNCVSRTWEDMSFANKEDVFWEDDFELDKNEQLIYEVMIIDDHTIKETAQILNISEYKIRKIMKSIKTKVIEVWKN